MLLEAGANVNAQNNNGLTALHMAVEYDYYWTSKVLVEAGADGELVSGEVRPSSPSLPHAHTPPRRLPWAPSCSPLLSSSSRAGPQGVQRHRGGELHREPHRVLLGSLPPAPHRRRAPPPSPLIKHCPPCHAATDRMRAQLQ